MENSSRDGNTTPTDLPLEKSVCRSGSNSETRAWNNRLVPNREKSTSRLYIVTLLIYLICRVLMLNIQLDEDKLESRLLGEISITSALQRTPHLCQKVKKN